MRRRLYSIPSVMSPDGSASERNAPPRPRMIWSMSGTERRSAALTLSRVTPKHLCRFNVLMWHRPKENALQDRIIRRASRLLAGNNEERPTRRYGVVPVRRAPFFLIDDSVLADVIHHCLSLEVEQLHLFYRMACQRRRHNTLAPTPRLKLLP